MPPTRRTAVLPATQFTDPAAVETWDASFRWRTAEGLRDLTIDDTWWRVADTVARSRGDQAPLWAHRYVDAFSRWRLLPDERLLRFAGTGNLPTELAEPAAALNVGCFVAAPFGSTSRFDRRCFMDTAALAVRLLDDALFSARFAGTGCALRIGVVGFGDALRKLGIAYAAPAALEQARSIASALAEGCLRGAVDVAEERGGDTGQVTPELAQRWEALGLPDALIARARRHGLRHGPLTAIRRQPLLARLANNASDALDALPPGQATDAAGDAAEAAIRAAMQPWIDEPIEQRIGQRAASEGIPAHRSADEAGADAALATVLAGTTIHP